MAYDPSFPMKTPIRFARYSMLVECVSCERLFNVGVKPKLGQSVTCPNCKEKLEITWLDPVEVDWPIDDADDDDDY